MNHGRRCRTLLMLGMLALAMAAHAQTDTVADLSRFYGGLHGAFVAFDTRTGVTLRYNPALCATRLSPASTFKIPNSLIGLETGVIPDQHYIIRWDSVQRPVAAWNRDHDLASAIANSVVWYYQELARRVGAERMQHWLDTLAYGNSDITGGIDRFWLGSSLIISPDEEVGFLRRLREGRLPVSKRSLAIVQHILIQDSTGHYVHRGKTGYATFGASSAVGWYVGWIERPEGAILFANCITTDKRETEGEAVFERRKPIALGILKALGALE